MINEREGLISPGGHKMINGRTRSILLQVAFKGAVEAGSPDRETVTNLYNLLISLHEELGIDPSEGAPRGGTGSRNSGTGAVSPEGETFMFNGLLIEDFRAAKSAPGSTVKPNYPDFKTVNGQPIDGVTTPRGAAWLYSQDGSANEAINELVAAADTKIF